MDRRKGHTFGGKRKRVCGVSDELRKAVAWAVAWAVYEGTPLDDWADFDDTLTIADAAIAVAKPIIEAAFVERLIAAAGDQALVRRVPIPGTYMVEEGEDLDEWLRSHLPGSDARPGGEGEPMTAPIITADTVHAWERVMDTYARYHPEATFRGLVSYWRREAGIWSETPAYQMG